MYKEETKYLFHNINLIKLIKQYITDVKVVKKEGDGKYKYEFKIDDKIREDKGIQRIVRD